MQRRGAERTGRKKMAEEDALKNAEVGRGRLLEAAAAAINFAANFGFADDTIHGHRESEANAAVVGMGVEIGLKTIRKGEVHAAVAGVNGPAPGHFRSGGDARFDTAVAGLQVENVEAPVNPDLPVPRTSVQP